MSDLTGKVFLFQIKLLSLRHKTKLKTENNLQFNQKYKHQNI